MTSKSSSSTSQTEPRPVPMTYELLETQPEKLQDLAYLMRGPAWEAAVQVFQAERTAQLERLVDSDDPIEQTYHRNVAKFLGNFMSGVEELIVHLDKQDREPEIPDQPDWMDHDSGSSDLEVEAQEGSTPIS